MAKFRNGSKDDWQLNGVHGWKADASLHRQELGRKQRLKPANNLLVARPRFSSLAMLLSGHRLAHHA